MMKIRVNVHNMSEHSHTVTCSVNARIVATVYPGFFFACRKFCEKRVNLYTFYFVEVIFCDLKRYIGICYDTQLRT
jgi:hypothetical protein